MPELRIVFEFEDRQIADELGSWLESDSEHVASKECSLRKAENIGELMSDDWHYLEYLIEFGAAAAAAAGKKAGAAVSRVVGRLLTAIRDRLSKSRSNEVRNINEVENNNPPMTSVTISIQEVTRTITITSESSDQALNMFAEEVDTLSKE